MANTLDASTMFRRNNMSLRILKMHLTKVGAVFLKDTLRPVLLKFRDAVDQVCVCVCVHVRVRETMCVRVCVCHVSVFVFSHICMNLTIM